MSPKGSPHSVAFPARTSIGTTALEVSSSSTRAVHMSHAVTKRITSLLPPHALACFWASPHPHIMSPCAPRFTLSYHHALAWSQTCPTEPTPHGCSSHPCPAALMPPRHHTPASSRVSASKKPPPNTAILRLTPRCAYVCPHAAMRRHALGPLLPGGPLPVRL